MTCASWHSNFNQIHPITDSSGYSGIKKQLGIYFFRHASLFTFNVEEVIDEQKFPEFLEWFQLRAGRSD